MTHRLWHREWMRVLLNGSPPLRVGFGGRTMKWRGRQHAPPPIPTYEPGPADVYRAVLGLLRHRSVYSRCSCSGLLRFAWCAGYRRRTAYRVPGTECPQGARGRPCGTIQRPSATPNDSTSHVSTPQREPLNPSTPQPIRPTYSRAGRRRRRCPGRGCAGR